VSGGKVWLVGAGPGDPELLTRRAERVLGSADLVLYDALVDARVLALAARAQRFPVGKRGGRPSFEQRSIEALMIRGARAGRTVVRLKAGDPFVFGRGGEEALALAEAGVEVEVVPGLSSAIAGPAAAGIPVTHRGLSSGFLVLTGFPEETWRSVLGTLPPASVTLVMMMAVGARREIAVHLLAHGWAASTPAAIVYAAWTESQRKWSGDLCALTTSEDDSGGLPGVLVIGAVASLAPALLAATHVSSSNASRSHLGA
jgi:uroporphyrin-III C-methyltransferase